MATVASAADVNEKVNYVVGNTGMHYNTYTSNKPSNINQQIRLNVYSWATPKSGDKVTTWLYDGSSLQEWGSAEILGGTVRYSQANKNLCLEIYRVGSTPEADVQTIVGNYYRDVYVQSNGKNLFVMPRSIHSTNMYLQETTAIPNSGGGKYLRWNTTGSDFYEYDISFNSY